MMIVTLYNHHLIDAILPDTSGLPLLRDRCRNEVVSEKAQEVGADFHLLSLRHIQSDLAMSSHDLKNYLAYWVQEITKFQMRLYNPIACSGSD